MSSVLMNSRNLPSVWSVGNFFIREDCKNMKRRYFAIKFNQPTILLHLIYVAAQNESIYKL